MDILGTLLVTSRGFPIEIPAPGRMPRTFDSLTPHESGAWARARALPPCLACLSEKVRVTCTFTSARTGNVAIAYSAGSRTPRASTSAPTKYQIVVHRVVLCQEEEPTSSPRPRRLRRLRRLLLHSHRPAAIDDKRFPSSVAVQNSLTVDAGTCMVIFD
jgi:hypothetical protein